METHTRHIGQYLVVDLVGSAGDVESVAGVQNQVEALMGECECDVAINLSHADYINSGLVGLLVHWWKLLRDRDNAFCLIEPNRDCREILEVTGIDRIVTVHESEEAFREAVARS